MIERLHQQFAIPVLRETDEEKLYSLARALVDGGLHILELTLMSESALKVIKRLSVEKTLLIGAGTVLNTEMAEKAIDAGARFLVSPGLNQEAVAVAGAHRVPFIPGVLTPTEIMQAQNIGCEVIKIFPVTSVGGTSYLKNLRGPFPGLKIMASGGIGLDDLKKYSDVGAYCVGTGGQLTPQDAVQNSDWKTITALAQDYVSEVGRFRP